MSKHDTKKVVLAYSGGLDTSVILKWLQTTYNCEVITFTADLGQGEELEPARKKAELLGIKPENIFMDDLREEFTRDFVFPMFRANTIYEGEYLLGTSIALACRRAGLEVLLTDTSPEALLMPAEAIEAAIVEAGPETVAAVYLEPVQNTGGTLPPPPGYFARVREIWRTCPYPADPASFADFLHQIAIGKLDHGLGPPQDVGQLVGFHLGLYRGE